MFKKNFVNLCIKKGISPSQVCKAIGLSNSVYSQWDDNSVPRRTTLKKIADYFGVSPESLLTDEPSVIPGNSIDVELSTLTAQLIKSGNDWEKKFIVNFLKLPPEGKEMFKNLLSDNSDV